LIINEYKTRLDKVEKFALNKAEELSVEAEELKEKTQNRFVLAFIVGLFFIILSSVLVIRNNIITEKKILKNQQDLAKSENLFRSLFENAPVGISMTGLDGSLKLNSSFCNILGYEEEELLAKSWKEITHKDDISESETIVKGLLNGKSDEAIFEKRYLHKSGEIVWTSVATHLLRDQFNKPLFFITFIIDKSDEKIYQNQLLDLNNKLKESNKELEEFTYVASHDLQEPLRTVNSFIQLFEKEVAETLNERTGKFLYFIKDGSHRMQTMINDLLTYSRVNSNKDANETVDLNELLKSVNHVLSEKIATKNAVIKVEELPKIKFVPSLIERVFRNLIENGIKYNTSKKPEISVSVITKNKFHEFAISDNGIGIDKKDTDKIFVIFKRLHAKSEYSGTGIGLSVCKRIINKNGGEIWVESEPGKGSTFKFTIPT
jgi:PAS domain S-box-containing protein